MSEITGIKIVPLIQHENKGIVQFMKNAFAGATKEDLEVLLKEVLKITL